jgi:hypothetical protein
MGEGRAMTEPAPTPTHRTVAGLRVPITLVPRLIEAIYARYPTELAGITDPDAAVRRALRAWIVETLADHEQRKAKAPLGLKVAQTVTEFEAKGNAAREKALADSELITEPTPEQVLSEAAQILGEA